MVHGSRISSAPRRKSGALRSIRDTIALLPEQLIEPVAMHRVTLAPPR